MAATKRKLSVYTTAKSYEDQEKKDTQIFPETPVDIKQIKTLMLLFATKEDDVLITIFKALAEFVIKREKNIDQLIELKVFDAIFAHEFYKTNTNVLVRRFALFLGDIIVEYQHVLQELTTERLTEIVCLFTQYYVVETDDFSLEYLSVMINKCLDDPHVATTVISQSEFLEKLYTITSALSNPDTIYHSFEALYKMLQVQEFEELQEFVSHPSFPIDRALCELTSEFPEIRQAALKLIALLVLDTSEMGLFQMHLRAQMLLQRLTQMLCELIPPEEAQDVVKVLSLALHSERMVRMFFQLDLFEKLVAYLASQPKMELAHKCMIISVFTEMGLYTQYLQRMYDAGITQWFIDCLLNEVPAPGKHILVGLVRLMKNPGSARSIVEAFENQLIERLLAIMRNVEVNVKVREQCSELINALLQFSYHTTAKLLMSLNYSAHLAELFNLPISDLSPDYILSLLLTIEELSKYDEYRETICNNMELIRNMAILLKKSFAHAVVVTNLFRCLCTLVDEEPARQQLLENHIAGSIKYGLQSLSNLVKTSVTNFIMQTARFPEFIEKYSELRGVLEVLLMFQKHAFCVSTWTPAIESILAKVPTLKFAIRNQLNFTDLTSAGDFFVCKRKFEDFRLFQNLLHSECSPIDILYVVNFNRFEISDEDRIHVPPESLTAEERVVCPEGWYYCHLPADEMLPTILDRLNETLTNEGLFEVPEKMKRCVDFDNIAQRVKIVAQLVADVMGYDLKAIDLNGPEECMVHAVNCHLKELRAQYHCSTIPLGMVRTGCQFERAVLFKALADQIGLPATLQRSVDGKIMFNEIPLPVVVDTDVHCDAKTLKFMSWRMLRPTHVVDLIYNVGEIYPMQSRQALQYLRLF